MEGANVYISPGYASQPQHAGALDYPFDDSHVWLRSLRPHLSRLEPIWHQHGYRGNRRPKTPVVVLLNGEKRAGKDTAAFYLMCALFEHGVSVESFAFANPIKRAIIAMLGIEDLDIDVFSDALKETIEPVSGLTYRKLAQLLGTDCGRDMVRDTLWIDLAWARIRRQETQVYIVKDCRFPNEGSRMRELNPEGTIVARITRDGRNEFRGVDMHPSEQFVFDVRVDHIFDNVTTAPGEEPDVLKQGMRALADQVIAKLQF